MEEITKNDLILVNDLSSRTYTGNRLLSNASEDEKQRLGSIKTKLKRIANFFAEKYNNIYGPFETSVSTGNDIAIGGTSFKRVWSGIFKGATNKQYAAQVSFVMNPNETCLDVGFYFGRASGHSRNREQRNALEAQLNNLGISLSDIITNDQVIKEKYDELFDFGFSAYSNGIQVLNENWYNIIRTNTKNSQIIAKIYPNDFHIIENSTIDSFVSQVIFLMSGIETDEADINPIIKPLTPEQRAKQAERLAQIGLNGELYVMKCEKEKLEILGLNNPAYPKHVALESMHYGYDILSLNDNNEEIYIEVKTTTRTLEDHNSRKFFMSTNEYNVYLDKLESYKLYRVYNIENDPSMEELDLTTIRREPDGFICEY